jgi:hypothetical protein
VSISHDAVVESFVKNVQYCKVILNQLFVASGRELRIYSLHHATDSWLAEEFVRYVLDDPGMFIDNLVSEEVQVKDLAFIDSLDLLLLLRSDRCIHTLHLSNRTHITSDSIFFMYV